MRLMKSMVQLISKKRNAVDSSGRIIQPKLATYKRGKSRRLSPFFKEGKDARREIQGKTWEMTWENVDFPITGEYTFKAEADDRVFIDIDDRRIGIVRGGSVNEFRARIPSGKKKVKLTLFNLKDTKEQHLEKILLIRQLR